MKRWEDLLGDIGAPFEFKLGLQPGARYQAPPPYPDVEVVSVEEVYVRRIVLQRLHVSAASPEDQVEQALEVVRVVAELEGGDEVEMARTASPYVEQRPRPVDIARCAGCGKPIPHGEAVVHEGEAYHRGRCIVEDDSAGHGSVPRRTLVEV